MEISMDCAHIADLWCLDANAQMYLRFVGHVNTLFNFANPVDQ